MKTESKKILAYGMLAGLQAGTVQVPHLLLKHYKKIPLSEVEVMVVIHILSFMEGERTDFPTIEEIQFRMSATADTVIQTIQNLVNKNWIRIDEATDPAGIHYEKYILTPLFEKIISFEIIQIEERAAASKKAAVSENKQDLYSVFEQEFARPLTPMELETISSWVDQDRYAEEIILAALKEAVFAGKVYFRYVDRILLDWGRNRVTTVEEAKQYSQKFRGSR